MATKPWGDVPNGISEFALMKEKENEPGKFEALMVPMPGGASSTRVAIGLLSEAWVAQFGGGIYKLRWVKKANGAERAGGYSPIFKMEGAPRSVQTIGEEEAAPLPVSGGVVDLPTVLMAQLNRESERFEMRLQEERQRAESERARERDHYERLEAARMQGRLEVLEQLKTLHQISPAPAPAPAPVSDAPPAWAAAIITRLDALEASFTDEDEDEAEGEEEDEAEDGITLAEAAKLSPMQEYLMNQAEKYGPLFMSWLEKNAPPGTVPAAVGRAGSATGGGAAVDGVGRSSMGHPVPAGATAVDTAGVVS